MKKVQLGQSSLHISEISLGCMSLPTSIEDARPIIDAAVDAGINYFDTADLYQQGVNEEMIGTLLAPYRDKVHIATKVGNRWQEGQEGWTWDASPQYIKEAAKESLRRLKVDVIDLYQLHGGTTEDQWPEIIETFNDLKREGIIREYGISSIRPNVFVPFFNESEAVSNMMQFNMFDRRAEEWFARIQLADASVVTRGTLAKGILTDAWQSRAKAYMSYDQQEILTILQQLEQHYGSTHALAIAFNLNYSAVASTVIGASSRKQLLESIQAYEKAQSITDFNFAYNLLKLDFYPDHRI